MKKLIIILPVLLMLAHFSAAEVESGKPAPEFTLPDIDGEQHSLADHNGKYVVLEWINFDCPFVKKHYEAGNVPQLQKWAKENDITWFIVNSSNKGKQGNFSAEEIAKRLGDYDADPAAYLLDTDGKVGKQYGAKTTPHMYVIDPEGVLIYQGALDDKPTTDKADIESAENYVKKAIEESQAGNPVSTASTKAYGCSVKY